MSKSGISLNNKYRVLLTEVLPYELPFMLDNEGFYQNMQDQNLAKSFSEFFRERWNKGWTIPFEYNIKKYCGDKSRKLSLIHPWTQLRCVDFYEKNDNSMLSLCSISPFSIRHISGRAKCIFKAEEAKDNDRQTSQNHVEIQNDEIEKKYCSYFRYTQYDRMYKFFTSIDYLRLEQKYTHLMKMDIASCFYHIYTHTISWAVKGKVRAKELAGKSTFENDFDKLMQHTNYNETNGIVVGPEISRIFAEIILQRIDINVFNRLKQEPYKLKLGRDYEVKRYVDDHYVYANTEKNLRLILTIYEEELQVYKLFVNEKKLEFFERPFDSNISEAKREIVELKLKFYEKWLGKDENGKYKHSLKKDTKVFADIVNEFRAITYKYKLKYGMLNRYFLSLLISQLENEMECEHSIEAEGSLLLLYVEVVFYVFSLDMSASASIKICRILVLLHKWAENCVDRTILPELEERIYREFKRCLDIYEVHREQGEINLEVLNLLLVLGRIMKCPIRRIQLVKIFNIEKNIPEEYQRLNYFQICTLLDIIGSNDDFKDIRTKIFEEIVRRLKMQDSICHADNMLLFFDVLACPYFTVNEKKSIFALTVAHTIKEDTISRKVKIFNTRRWFFNWDKSCDISALLSKKEYHLPYE